MKTLRLIAALAVLPLWACSPKPLVCDPKSCSGCCDTSGACQTGGDAFACGAGGLLCSTCLPGQFCGVGICQGGNTGGGGGTGGGQGGGTGGGTGPLTCATGRTACAAFCVDTQTDERNCGNCGTFCNSNQFCNRGMCTVLPSQCMGGCPKGFFCAGTECQPGCNVNADCPQPGMCNAQTHLCSCVTGYHGCGEACDADNNVSSCGSSCANCGGISNAVPACSNNLCDFTCNTGFHRCGNECKDNNALTNCGSSCTPCTPPPNSSAICTGTACDFVCNSGFHRCGNACVDNNSVNSCGATSCTACTPPANAVATCNGVSCDFTCNAGFHRCGAQCVSNNATASCGTSCSACTPPANSTATCNGVACGFSCNVSTHACNGACVSNNSVNSCGTSSCVSCTPPPNGTSTCNGVACDFVCNSGNHRCGAACSDDFSVNACGSSCNPCPNGPANSVRTCDGFSCGYQCLAGFHSCGGQCVSDTSTTQCGASCVACTAPANASPICSSGACDFTCNLNFHRCGNACLANTDADACGASCSVCPAGPGNSTRACVSGACGFTCNGGFNSCGGSCVANDFVAACGASCSTCTSSGSFDRPVCNAGTCGTSCITSCGAMCVDVQRDGTNCGLCGTTCGGGQACTQGECRTQCATGQAFVNTVPYTSLINTATYRFVMEDLNNDGRVDLIDNGNVGIQVRLSNIDGTFGAVQAFPMTGRPIAIAAVDLDGDGFKDLVATRPATTTQVTVVRNNAGTLAAGVNYSTSTFTPTAMAILDANGDGRLDIVLATTSTVSVLLPQSPTAGVFSTSTTIAQPLSNASTLEAAQFDTLGTDLVYATTTQYAISRQTSTGVFTTSAPVSQAVVSLKVADLNGNGTQDLLIRSGSGSLVIAQGSGTGTFTSSSISFSGSAGVIAADLNNDAMLDLISGTTGSVYVGLATAQGVWPTAPPAYLVNSPGGPQNLVAVGQLMGDARPEIFSAGIQAALNNLSTLINDGAGAFPGARASGVSGGPYGTFAAGDFDGDGDRDLIVIPTIALGGTGSAPVIPGNNDGSFGGAVATLTLRGDEFAVGRLNADSMDDFVAIIENSGTPGLEVRLAAGAGAFAAATTVSTTAVPVKVVIADLNQDTFNDLLMASASSVQWFQGNGDGSFQSARVIATPALVSAIAVGDLNLDSRLDVLVNTSVVTAVFLNLGSGQFSGSVGSMSTASTVTDILVGDFDQDGRPDVVSAAPTGFYLGQGAGNGTLLSQGLSASLQGRLRTADLDNDRLLDLICVTAAGDLQIARGQGSLVFQPKTTWAPGRVLSPTALVVDRINGDTFRDVVVLNPTGEVWTYLGLCR